MNKKLFVWFGLAFGVMVIAICAVGGYIIFKGWKLAQDPPVLNNTAQLQQFRSEKEFKEYFEQRSMSDDNCEVQLEIHGSRAILRLIPLKAGETAEEIAGYSMPSVLIAKEQVNRAFETTLNEGLRFERRTFYSLFATEDQKEGMAAFSEKRKPDFKNK